MKIESKKLISTVSSKGQVTIPKAARDTVALVVGSKVELQLEDGTLLVT